MALSLGFVMIVLVVDRNMEFYDRAPYGHKISVFGIFLFYMLSTLSASVVWIIDAEKVASAGLGMTSTRVQERVYLTAYYAVSISSAALVVIIFCFSSSGTVVVSGVGTIYCILTSVSFYCAGRRVDRDLRVV
eukprot:CAMPEP_0171608738 /NCGR_PEP_ID=MMETSP0990-20121206/9082_1 /TAXON_ID=483369 /ORGANISM="non described non described, Strain CCMP2098" /LENGTH=132 /DNA_ID=CAMNT_0012171913 /DNA_START=618 /DNA_END=1013 /DNA_ORIENTATION=-